jgi:hypothetical protein
VTQGGHPRSRKQQQLAPHQLLLLLGAAGVLAAAAGGSRLSQWQQSRWGRSGAGRCAGRSS